MVNAAVAILFETLWIRKHWAINNPILKDDILWSRKISMKKWKNTKTTGASTDYVGGSFNGWIDLTTLRRNMALIKSRTNTRKHLIEARAYRLGQGRQGRQFKPGSEVCNITEATDLLPSDDGPNGLGCRPIQQRTPRQQQRDGDYRCWTLGDVGLCTRLPTRAQVLDEFEQSDGNEQISHG